MCGPLGRGRSWIITTHRPIVAASQIGVKAASREERFAAQRCGIYRWDVHRNVRFAGPTWWSWAALNVTFWTLQNHVDATSPPRQQLRGDTARLEADKHCAAAATRQSHHPSSSTTAGIDCDRSSAWDVPARSARLFAMCAAAHARRRARHHVSAANARTYAGPESRRPCGCSQR